jgi:hypothetical protein
MADLVVIDGTDVVRDSRSVINANFAALNADAATAATHAGRVDNPHGVTADQLGLSGVAAHLSRTDNPHGVTAAQVGISNAVTLAKVTESGGLPLWDGAAWPGGSGGSGGVGRELLTANRTYYVRVDGNDANNGLTDTAEGAFATIQKAADVVMMLDLGIYSVTIRVGAGTYAQSTTLGKLIGAGSVTIDGAGMVNTIIAPTTGTAFTVNGVGWVVSNMRLAPVASGHCIVAFAGSALSFGSVDFGPVTGPGLYHINCMGGRVSAIGDYKISGSATVHWLTIWQGIIEVVGRTVTITGTPAFSVAFAQAERLGMIRVNGNTFVGSATGSRYLAQSNSLIFTIGGVNYLPGNAAGTTGTGGLYA